MQEHTSRPSSDAVGARDHRTDGVILGVGALLCAATAVLGEARFDNSLYFYSDLKDKPGAFQGSMSIVSAFLLVISATLLARIGERLRADRRVARSFTAFAGLLAFLAFDELAMFHEWSTAKLAACGVPKFLGMDQDVYIFLAYGLIAVGCSFRMVPVAMRHRHTVRLGALVLACATASEAVDFVPWDSLSIAAQRWLGPLEEGLKTIATLCATLSAHALLQDVEGSDGPRDCDVS